MRTGSLLPLLSMLLTALVSSGLAAQQRVSPARGQICSTVQPGTLADTIAANVEHERLRGAVLGYLSRADIASPTGLFVIVTDSTHSHTLAEFVDSSVSEALVAGVKPIVSDYVIQTPMGRPVSVVVRLDSVSFPRVVRGESRACTPAIKNKRQVREMMGNILRAHPDFGTPALHDEKARIGLVVDRNGTVPFAYLLSASGDPQIDRYLTAMAQEMEFYPALVDGTPIDVFVMLPLGFRAN